jgi:hypothetical protein
MDFSRFLNGLPRFFAIVGGLLCLVVSRANETIPGFIEPSLTLPAPGQQSLRILSPTVLEIAWITQGPSAKTTLATMDGLKFFDSLQSGGPAGYPTVKAAGKSVPVQAIGFKRRPVYAPLRHRDLRVGNFLYLLLAEPLADKQDVAVTISDERFTPSLLVANVDSLRLSPAIHVNQVGYFPAWRKTATVGFYLGTMGELAVAPDTAFRLVGVHSGEVVHEGRLVPQPDLNFPYPWYKHVLTADFSFFKKPGEYRLVVPGLGASHRFLIGEGVPATFGRTYALGLYHQRCGMANALPHTRFLHGPCHTAPAEVPTATAEATAEFLKTASKGFNNPEQSAPPLVSVETSLYPFVRKGEVDVSGGHHDAGDYSKYTINSAGTIHHLVFAADSLPGAGELDNLGIPESGNGKSDLLEEAKWEADFLLKMQDADGGFYFLVYPRERRYEGDVLPDQGDPQVVWPKTTSVTAASIAALAQCASSPRFKREFPETAERYLKAARLGWKFLITAVDRYGKAGAYQKLTHYGDEFSHNDELAWAACELFAATGEAEFHERATAWLDPANSETHRWGWWRLCESYGRAIRSYAFAARSGRLSSKQLSPRLLSLCEGEIVAGADDWLRASQQSAYGLSLPEATKRVLGAGWYFPLDYAFDLAVACQLDYPKNNDPRPDFFAAVLSNLNYEAGANPVNQSFLTGLGWQRQREIVSNYAQNDRRILPPSGIPIGSIQNGFGWLDFYKEELGNLCFPYDGDNTYPYPMYDRWGDSFNLATEFVIVNQARGLAVTSWLMAQTPLRAQEWKSVDASFVDLPDKIPVGKPVTLRLKIPGMDPDTARVVWEARDQEPAFGSLFTFTPNAAGEHWVEAEVQCPDGRRAYASGNILVVRP